MTADETDAATSTRSTLADDGPGNEDRAELTGQGGGGRRMARVSALLALAGDGFRRRIPVGPNAAGAVR